SVVPSCVALVLLHSLLQRFEIRFFSARNIISNVTTMPAFTQHACIIALTNGRGGVQICTRRIKSEITEIAYALSMFYVTLCWRFLCRGRLTGAGVRCRSGSKSRGEDGSSGKGLENGAHTGRAAGSAGLLDEYDIHAPAAAEKHHQGVFYKRGIG